MSFPKEQTDELKIAATEVKEFEEAGVTYFLLSNLQLPDGCFPALADALLCPSARDGYSCRLFFTQIISTKSNRNWNANCVRIGNGNWYAISWKVAENLRLAQMVAAHLGALR